MKNLKSMVILFLTMAVTLTATVSATEFGSSWSSGMSTVQGYSVGGSITNKVSRTHAHVNTPNGHSHERSFNRESTLTASSSVFGMDSTYNAYETFSGGIARATRHESGSGWSNGFSTIATVGVSGTRTHEHNYLNGVSGTTDSRSRTLYANFTTLTTTDEFDFGNYSVKVGVR